MLRLPSDSRFEPAAAAPSLTPDSTLLASWCDRLALVVLAAVAVIAALTFGDYGLGWDDYTHWQYGDLLLALYGSGFADQRAFSFVNLFMYGGGFDLASALAIKFLPFEPFVTRRLVGAVVGLVGLFVTWRLGRRLARPVAGLVALLLLATCPLYYGHMFMNAKDAPFAVAMAIALLGTVRALQEYPRPQPATVALFGVGLGLAIGSRVMGGFALINAGVPFLAIFATQTRRLGAAAASREWGRFVLALVPAALLAYLVIGLVWPWSVTSPLNPFRAVEYFSNFFERPWRELFGGQLILVPDMPRSYVPTLILFTFPEIILVLGAIGLVGALLAAARMWLLRHGEGIGNRAALLAVLLAATLPVIITVATRPAMYNGIRHFVFLTPPIAVLGGVAATWIAQWLRPRGSLALGAGAAVLALGVTTPVVDMVRLHPYEYTNFNHAIGGVAGARPLYMLDYWGLSIRQASLSLREVLAKRGETPTGEEKWTVAVCGPHPAAVVALGPQYSAIWDPKGADFAMMLAEFYCLKLDAPLLIEIQREGVVYARVYDIRGLSISKLTAVKGPD